MLEEVVMVIDMAAEENTAAADTLTMTISMYVDINIVGYAVLILW